MKNSPLIADHVGHSSEELVTVYLYTAKSSVQIVFFHNLSPGIFWPAFVSDIAIFVLKRDVKLQLTNFGLPLGLSHPPLHNPCILSPSPS